MEPAPPRPCPGRCSGASPRPPPTLLPSAPGTDPSLDPHTREVGIPAPSAPDARAPTCPPPDRPGPSAGQAPQVQGCQGRRA